MYYKTYYDSPLGQLLLMSDEDSLLGLWIEGQKYYEDTTVETARVCDDLEILVKTKRWLDRYFHGEKPDIRELSLKPIGTPFRQRVWSLLCTIPYGEITTYGKLAKQVANKMGKDTMSAQAIGNAVGHNPISIIIPCHRVVGTDGSFTGYAGGLDKKIALLKLEQVDMTRLYVPKKGTAL